MRYSLLLSLLLFFPCALAEEPSGPCCVDEDISAAFNLEETYSREWPAQFPITPQLDGFEFVGSSQYKRFPQQSVAWKSPLSLDTTRSLFDELLVADGWTRIPEIQHAYHYRERGFIPHELPVIQDYQQYCRARDGNITMAASDTPLGIMVRLTHRDYASTRDCRRQIEERSQSGMRHFDGVVQHLPALMLPESIEARPSNTSSGGHDEARSQMVIDTRVTASELSFHFERQMQEQGWRFDADFSGGRSNGHIWHRSTDGTDMVCMIAVLETQDGLFLHMYLKVL